MKILYIDIADLLRHIPEELSRMGYEVEELKGFAFGADYDATELQNRLEEMMNQARKSYEAVISFNYFYVISDVCNNHGIAYISWIYDSPQAELFHPSLSNGNNRIFVFDRSLLERLRAYRPEANLFYLPLAGNVAKLQDVVISPEDEQKYSKDISFVGGMYENNVYNQTWSGFSEEQKQQLATYLMEHLCRWEKKRPWPELPDSLVEFYCARSERGTQLGYDMPLPMYYGCMVLSRKLCEMERLTVLNRLSERHPISLYTNSKSPHLGTVRGEILPPVDYCSDMLKVFHLSRINLNMTLPSIETGVPLRVFDIMSVGGFCLTNRQEEAFELFEVGKEIETYGNLEELYDKTDFYLRHEDLRLRIAMNGYMAVRDRHNYGIRLKGMLKSIG